VIDHGHTQVKYVPEGNKHKRDKVGDYNYSKCVDVYDASFYLLYQEFDRPHLVFAYLSPKGYLTS